MRISDWSSDVCSSDLVSGLPVRWCDSHADQDRPQNLRGAPARRPDVAGTDAGAKSGDRAGHCKAGHPALSAQTTLAMRRIAEELKRFSYRFGDEVGLHRGIQLALASQQIEYLHERSEEPTSDIQSLLRT